MSRDATPPTTLVNSPAGSMLGRSTYRLRRGRARGKVRAAMADKKSVISQLQIGRRGGARRSSRAERRRRSALDRARRSSRIAPAKTLSGPRGDRGAPDAIEKRLDALEGKAKPVATAPSTPRRRPRSRDDARSRRPDAARRRAATQADGRRSAASAARAAQRARHDLEPRRRRARPPRRRARSAAAPPRRPSTVALRSTSTFADGRRARRCRASARS